MLNIYKFCVPLTHPFVLSLHVQNSLSDSLESSKTSTQADLDSLNPVLSVLVVLLLDAATLDVLADLLDGEIGIKRTRKASERVLDGVQSGRHKRLELAGLQTGGNDKGSDLVSVNDVSSLGGGFSDTGGSVTLVEVLVTLLGSERKSLVTVLGHSVEQVEHVSGPVLLPWSKQLGDKCGSHFRMSC